MTGTAKPSPSKAGVAEARALPRRPSPSSTRLPARAASAGSTTAATRTSPSSTGRRAATPPARPPRSAKQREEGAHRLLEAGMPDEEPRRLEEEGQVGGIGGEQRWSFVAHGRFCHVYGLVFKAL